MKIIIDDYKFIVDIANSFKKKFLGLMGKKNIKKGLFLPKTRSIHTFFMKETIDIIMINKNNEIIYYEENVPKNRIIIKKKAYHTIELPHNTINKIKNIDNIKKITIQK